MEEIITTLVEDAGMNIPFGAEGFVSPDEILSSEGDGRTTTAVATSTAYGLDSQMDGYD